MFKLAAAGPRLVKAAAESTTQVLKATLETQCNTSCCEIPETDCPPKCVCCIQWSGIPGDTLHHHLTVTNTGKKKRTFEWVPVPFACGGEVVKVTPNKKALEPCASFQATVSFKIPEELTGSRVQTHILLKGAYEQCVLIDLHVKSRQASCCDIRQGEVPTRVKAQHWYHHFQCTEPCFESLESSKD